MHIKLVSILLHKSVLKLPFDPLFKALGLHPTPLGYNV